MTVTYGFYDSLAGDRTYNAEQMSRIFEGVIIDGVFGSVGDKFAVTASGTNMNVTVGTGRAWFFHTWTLNDAPLILTVGAAAVGLNRIDSVVLEVNKNTATRANTIKIVAGTPASSPVAPTLSNTATVKQYALANIYVGSSVTTISQANITQMVGTTGTPYVTGPLQTISTDTMYAQWDAEFNAWFTNLQEELNASQAANLQNQINAITTDLSAASEANETYGIFPSVASNNLTLTLKRFDGTNPTVTNPLKIRVGDTVYTLTNAVTFTANAGTSYLNVGSSALGGNDVDFFVYAIGQTGTGAGFKLGFARKAHATNLGMLVSTNTSESGIISNVVTYNNTDPCRVIGRFRARMSGGGAAWSIPNANVVNFPVYRTGELTWTPGATFAGGTTDPTSLTATIAKYQLEGASVRYHYQGNLVRGSGNRTVLTIAIPFAAHLSGTAPANALTNITAAGLAACTGYISGATIVFYNIAMANDGSYYCTGVSTLT